MNEIHRMLAAERERSALDKALSNFFAITPAERAEFVAAVNRVLGKPGNPRPMALTERAPE